MSRRYASLVWLIIIAVPSAAGIVNHYHYLPTSLPSEQGWEFQGFGFQEDQVFSIQDGVLVQNSMGMGYGTQGTGRYVLHLDSTGASSAVVRVRARVLDCEMNIAETIPGFGFGGWPLGWFGGRYMFGLDTEAIRVSFVLVRELDATQWTEYTLVYELDDDPLAGTKLLVAGEPSPFEYGVNEGASRNSFMFGDEGPASNTHAEIAEIEITLFDGDPTPVAARTFSAVKALFAD